jgi:nucleoid DNA-binding protein
MRQELSKHISDLLFQVERLSIPNLGSFELGQSPALVDQVQGQVAAPSMSITFNSNLVLDDGILTDHLVAKNSWTTAEAQVWVRNAVMDIEAALGRREIVELPEVGRFFRNFEGRLQFVADNVNYNLESFGLQPVAAQPIARSAAEKMNAPGIKKTPPPVAPARSSLSAPLADWFQANMIWLLGVSLLLLSLVIFLLFLRSDPTDQVAAVEDVPQERINASPSMSPIEETTADSKENTVADISSPDEEAPSGTTTLPEEPMDTEAPTLAPEEHTAVIAVGLFGNPDNVENKLAELSKQGFSPYSAREGKNTRVGVNVRYTDESELRKVLRDIKRLHTESAFVIYKDGKRIR